MKVKVNPYELGIKDYKEGKENSNPYSLFSERWALYNRGYNSCWMQSNKTVGV